MTKCPKCGVRSSGQGPCPGCALKAGGGPKLPPLPARAKDARQVLVPQCHPAAGLLGLIQTGDVLELVCRECGFLVMKLEGFGEGDLDAAPEVPARPVPLSDAVADPELRAMIEAYERESAEWQAIATELVAGGHEPSAYQVTLEQRKRMLARGERPVDVPRMMALAGERGIA